MIDLDELERLLAKATPGPWGPHEYAPKGGTHVMIWDEPTQRRLMCIECVSREDAALIVILRNAAPELIAAARCVAELEAENMRLREALEVVENPDKLLCCTGYHCGCQGATVGGYAAWVMRDDRNAAMNELIAITADEYGVQNDGTD